MDYIRVLHIITDPTRYQILCLLMERHYCVRAISKKLGISAPAVSQQMNILKKSGIITGKRIGYYMHYLVNIDLITQIFQQFAKDINASNASQISERECICEYECECGRKQ